MYIMIFLFLNKNICCGYSIKTCCGYSLENICCGYSLEVPQGSTSNEYQQHMFLLRNKKNITSFWEECLDFRIDY